MRLQRAVSALWNVGLCGRWHEGPQLMRKSLDVNTSIRATLDVGRLCSGDTRRPRVFPKPAAMAR
jgi:hypothetical protein